MTLWKQGIFLLANKPDKNFLKLKVTVHYVAMESWMKIEYFWSGTRLTFSNYSKNHLSPLKSRFNFILENIYISRKNQPYLKTRSHTDTYNILYDIHAQMLSKCLDFL
jgi:hypothetical protein